MLSDERMDDVVFNAVWMFTVCAGIHM